MHGSADYDFCVCFQGPTGYKGEQGEVGKDGEKVKNTVHVWLTDLKTATMVGAVAEGRVWNLMCLFWVGTCADISSVGPG